MANHVITRSAEGTYTLTTDDGRTFACTRWFEKSRDKWHVLIPKEARELTGRTYIAEALFKNTDTYTFETKTTHRDGSGWGESSSWKSRMTPEEKVEYEGLAKRMAEIEALAKSRPAKVLTEEEKLIARIEKMQKELEAMRASKK